MVHDTTRLIHYLNFRKLPLLQCSPAPAEHFSFDGYSDRADLSKCGPDWKHFCGAPFSDVCIKPYVKYQWKERAGSKGLCQARGSGSPL